MYEHLSLGLAKHATQEQRDRIDIELSITFEDIRDSLDSLEDNVKEYERSVRHILYGDHHKPCGM